MCTAPPILHRSAHIIRFRAQSLIVCCPTAFRPDFRRRLPDQEWRISRVRRRVLRRLKVRLTPRAHSTAARPAEPTPPPRSRAHQPLPLSPSLALLAPTSHSVAHFSPRGVRFSAGVMARGARFGGPGPSAAASARRCFACVLCRARAAVVLTLSPSPRHARTDLSVCASCVRSEAC